MRIILYTGKGGVGKTSVAAATALRCAQLGYRTVVLSTDVAHSLADSLDTGLGPEPIEVASNLWGQEIDVYHEIKHNWGTIQHYMASVMAWRGLDPLIADEMTVFPGMEELTSLLQITRHAESGKYDVIIIDSAPTGETLRLLAFPEVARWWVEKIFPVQRRAAKVIRPLIKPMIDIPLPSDEVFESVHKLFKQLDKMHDLLADVRQSSIRLVLNPEKMVIKEAQRTFTYLNLFGYMTDAIICNRMIPDSVQDEYFDTWKATQVRYRQLVEESFTPLPILYSPLFENEMVGLSMLSKMAEVLFADEDPTKMLLQGETQSIKKVSGHYVLTIPLPFTSKENVNLMQNADELIIQVGNQRRNVALPRVLVGLAVIEAKMENDELRIRFEERKEN